MCVCVCVCVSVCGHCNEHGVVVLVCVVILWAHTCKATVKRKMFEVLIFTPALLMRMSTLPNSWRAFSVADPHTSASLRSRDRILETKG